MTDSRSKAGDAVPTDHQLSPEQKDVLRAQVREIVEKLRVTAANCKDPLLQRALFAVAKASDPFTREPKCQK